MRNFVYFKNGKYIIRFVAAWSQCWKYFSDDFGTDIGNKGIESPTTNQKCPAWSSSSWLSWVGVGAWENDENLRIKCQDGKFFYLGFISNNRFRKRNLFRIWILLCSVQVNWVSNRVCRSIVAVWSVWSSIMHRSKSKTKELVFLWKMWLTASFSLHGLQENLSWS